MVSVPSATELACMVVDIDIPAVPSKFAVPTTSPDSAMALALAYWCLQDVKIKEQAYLPDWVLNNRAMKAKTRQASYRRY